MPVSDKAKVTKTIKDELKLKVGDRIDMMMNVDTTSVKDLGEGVFEAIITTSEVDRMGESIDYSGIDTSAYMNNPVVLYGHDYQSLPIGKTLKLAKSNVNQNWKARFQLATNILPFAATVAAMLKAGYLNATSIGGVVKQMSEDFTKILKMEMVEFSIVPVPANASALITSRSLKEITGKSIEEIAHEFHEFVSKSTSQEIEKSLDINELDRHIKSLEDLTTILKSAKELKTSEKDNPETIRITLKKAGGQVSETGQKIIRLTRSH